jgi:hypothetical protein
MAITNNNSAVSTVANALGDTTPIGGAIGVVASIFQSLGIKGSTQHLSYDVVAPLASRFQSDTYQYLNKIFGQPSFAVVAPIAGKKFVDEMQKFWGLGASLNQTIATDAIASGQRGDLGRLLWLFCIWVGTNIDQARPETFQQFMRDEFRAIFLAAYSEAGYDTNRLDPGYIAPAISVTQPYNGGSPGVTYVPGQATASPLDIGGGLTTASLGGALGIFLILGAGVYFFMSKGGH